jgi:hypothetical protein
MRVLHDEQEFADKFINYMPERNIKEGIRFSCAAYRCALYSKGQIHKKE